SPRAHPRALAAPARRTLADQAASDLLAATASPGRRSSFFHATLSAPRAAMSAARKPPSRSSRPAEPHGAEICRLLVERVREYAIFMLDPDGHVISWNEGAARIKGYDADEII